MVIHETHERFATPEIPGTHATLAEADTRFLKATIPRRRTTMATLHSLLLLVQLSMTLAGLTATHETFATPATPATCVILVTRARFTTPATCATPATFLAT